MQNILTIDVEDWYCDLNPSEWGEHDGRVVSATRKILKMLRETNNKATFFILGYIAEKYPQLVKEIRKENHEIGSHGYWHRRISDQTPQEFEKDLVKSLRVLERITKERVRGYRAPQFTISENTAYAISLLKKHGLKYDSSIFPAKTPLYGAPLAPLYPYNPCFKNINKEDSSQQFLELPISVYETPIVKKRVPLIGGIYFRFFPYFVTKYAIRKINRQKKPVVFFAHPWEFDPGKPRVAGLKWNHYYGIKRSTEKFRKLLKEHKFISIREWVKNNGN